MRLLKSHFCFDGVTEFFEHESESTQTSMKFAVHRPKDVAEIRGGLIWLSGLTCTHENFITKSGVQKALQKKGVVVVCPDTSPRGLDLPGEHDSYDFGSGAGFYLDATVPPYDSNYKMYSYINKELYSLMQGWYDLKNTIGITGHSMGGHGALQIGLKNPNKYCSISAFSPICHPTKTSWGQKALRGYIGEDKEQWNAFDSTWLVEHGYRHHGEILIDQGTDDEFYPDQLSTIEFKQSCEKYGQPARILMHQGFDHSYFFISTFIEDHVDHFCHALNNLS